MASSISSLRFFALFSSRLFGRPVVVVVGVESAIDVAEGPGDPVDPVKSIPPCI